MSGMKHVNSTVHEFVKQESTMRLNDATYTQVLGIRDRLDTELADLQRKIEEVGKNLESISRTLELLDRIEESTGTVATDETFIRGSRVSAGSIDVASLRGMKQVDALEKIAQHNGGEIRTADAKRLFLQAALIKNPKNANNIIFGVIQRSGLFERVEKGVYRLAA